MYLSAIAAHLCMSGSGDDAILPKDRTAAGSPLCVPHTAVNAKDPVRSFPITSRLLAISASAAAFSLLPNKPVTPMNLSSGSGLDRRVRYKPGMSALSPIPKSDHVKIGRAHV